MLIEVFIGSVILGWFFVNVILNKWTNDGIDESNNSKKNTDNGKSTKRPPKTKKKKVNKKEI